MLSFCASRVVFGKLVRKPAARSWLGGPNGDGVVRSVSAGSPFRLVQGEGLTTFSRPVAAPTLRGTSVVAAQAVILGFEEIDMALVAGHPDWNLGDFGSSNGFGFFAGEHEADGTIDSFVGTCCGDGGFDSGFGNGVILGQQALFSPFASWGDETSLDSSVFSLDLVSATSARATNLDLASIPTSAAKTTYRISTG